MTALVPLAQKKLLNFAHDWLSSLLPHCLDDVKGHILRRLHALLMRHSSALSGVPLAVREVGDIKTDAQVAPVLGS